MAGIGNLGNIIDSFVESVTQVFGGAGNNAANMAEKGGLSLLSSEQQSMWIGNAGTDKNKARYGFATMTLDGITSDHVPSTIYYLDIPPQAITQKEVFANNISATRKGVIVESEGVVFKDILIQGTTGIFPGKRGEINSPRPNVDFTAAPTAPAGVDPKTGRSTASKVSTLSGYEEFILLRKFFLKYAQDKIKNDGNLFLIFLNEKDMQSIIVEPLEFIMERSSKNPMMYNYKILLKGIGDLDNIIANKQSATDSEKSWLENALLSVGNVAANIEATISSARTIANAAAQTLTRISQSAERTINGPLRQLQFGAEDLKNGTTSVLSASKAIQNNAVLANESRDASFDEFKRVSGLTSNNESERVNIAAQYLQQKDFLSKLNNDAKTPMQRSFVEGARDELDSLQFNLADFIGLGDPLFDAIKGRTATLKPDPLKVISDEEFLLLGSMASASAGINSGLATNILFESDAELSFEQALKPFKSDLIPEDQQPTAEKPTEVKEIVVQRNDTLERIAQREYNDALRWIDIVILNSLKPPYISEAGGDGVVKPGEKLLIGVR